MQKGLVYMRNRWLIALAAIGIHISIGSVYAWSVLTKPIMAGMGITLKETTWTFSLAILFLGLSAGFLGSFVEKLGPKKSGLLATLFFGTGMLGTALAIEAGSLAMLYLFYGIIGGIGLGIGYITPVSTLVKYFPNHRGFATGLAIMGFGFAFKSKQVNYQELRRSSTKKIKHPFLRTKSTMVNQLQKKKSKKEQKESEKNQKEIISKIGNKRAYKQSDFNQIMKNISSKSSKSPKLLLKRNSFYKKVISTKHFYLIRKQINQKLKNTYKSPFMDYFIKKGYYIHHKKSDYPKYYNYYMICYLMNNKRCQLTLRYYDHLLFYNNQEYLIRYFGKTEYFIIINYLLFFVYDKDIETISKIKKKIVSYKEIQIMFNDLLKNNYNFTGTMEILDDIAVYYRYSGINMSNLSKMLVNLENVKPVFEKKIKYLYAKDVPPLSFPNSYPNLFPLIGVIFDYIKKYLKMRKMLKVKTDSSDNCNSKKDNILIEPEEKEEQKGKSYYEHKMPNKNKNKISENNFLMNLSLSFSKSNYMENESLESFEFKNHHNSNRRLKIDNDIYDVETLFEKILFEFGYNIKNKNAQKEEKPISKSVHNLYFKKGIKRGKTMKNMNVKKILSKNSIKFQNILKKQSESTNIDIFKTSVLKSKAKESLIIDNKNKDKIHSSTKISQKSLVKRNEFISQKYGLSSQNNFSKILKNSSNSVSSSEKDREKKGQTDSAYFQKSDKRYGRRDRCADCRRGRAERSGRM